MLPPFSRILKNAIFFLRHRNEDEINTIIVFLRMGSPYARACGYAMTIQRPIFIIGSGRSGTSLLYRLLAVHPDLCWFSNLSDRCASFPFLAVTHRLLDLPGVGHELKKLIMSGKQFSLLPSEGGRIYHEICQFEQGKKTTEKDIQSVHSDFLFRIIGAHIRVTGKTRFLNKQTANTQRLRLMHALFPDAYWIHIIRDGRAVANSLSRVIWWPSVALWWHGGKTPSQLARSYKDPILLCAEHWRRNVTEIRSARTVLGRHYREIRYEELVENPRKSLASLLAWCKLSVSPSYLRMIPDRLPNKNNQWQQGLTDRQKMLLQREIRPLLRALRYSL